jgi:hypothetical protein
MTERLRRITVGTPPVTYSDPKTWTDEVRRLYGRIRQWDCTALAPLLKWDLEFIRRRPVFGVLVLLKFTDEYPAALARRELRKVANVIAQRPRRQKTKLPPGDQLEVELKSLTAFIDQHQLLKRKKTPRALEQKLHRLLRLRESPMFRRHPALRDGTFGGEWSDESGVLARDEEASLADIEAPHKPGSPEFQAFSRLCDSLLRTTSIPGRGFRRGARSWALAALADYLNADEKQIEKRITREVKSGRRRR